MTKTAVIEGKLHLHSETGTEGGDWALQDRNHITGEGEKERWDYKGLHCLRDGDHLRIFDKADPTKTVWEGVVALKQYESFTETAGGLWIHADQIGVPRDTWAAWFFDGHPARLLKRLVKK